MIDKRTLSQIFEDADKWAHFADSPQTALMLGSTLDPNSEQDWVAECNRLVAVMAARAKATKPVEPFDFEAHLALQREWSEKTFGPDPRVNGITSHIRKELDEILANPTDLYEWLDVAILALDGAWRAGYSPKEIIEALVSKQQKNMLRKWPDWRTAPPDTAIEHVRDEPAPVRTLSGDLENFTVRVEGGKYFRCNCGCNVFHKPDNTKLNHYKCNGCGNEYDGE